MNKEESTPFSFKDEQNKKALRSVSKMIKEESTPFSFKDEQNKKAHRLVSKMNKTRKHTV